jgi:hypothetical protein
MLSRPLALTDEQLDLLHRMAWPLAPADRAAFLELVAERLRGQTELGDGVVHRIAVQCQRAFWSPTLDERRARAPSKWAR